MYFNFRNSKKNLKFVFNYICQKDTFKSQCFFVMQRCIEAVIIYFIYVYFSYLGPPKGIPYTHKMFWNLGGDMKSMKM